MRGPKSKLWFSLSVALCFCLWPISSATADHVLTDQQYQQLTSNLDQLAQIVSQQKATLSEQAQTISRLQTTIGSQADTLSRQQATIQSSLTSLTELSNSLPTLKTSFNRALGQLQGEITIWKIAAGVCAILAVGATTYALVHR